MRFEGIKKILFVIPPSGLYRRDDRCQSKVEDQTVRIIFPPIDLTLLAAIARQNNLQAKIIDFPAESAKPQDIKKIIEDFKPDIIFVDTTAATLWKDLDFISVVKKILPQTFTIAKGETLHYFYKEIFENCPDLDLVIGGEPEESFEKLIRGVEWNVIKGLIFRSDSDKSLINTGLPEPIENLDTLPFPARDLLNNSLYRSPETDNALTIIHANRGCPARCIFCPAGKISDFKIRYRSPDNIISEIKECVEKFGIREFLFHGDTFTMKKRWVIDLCKKIVDENLKIRWGCNSRTDTFDEERAEWMKKAGCWVVAFGVESGSQEILDKMQKGARLESAITAVNICKKVGLRSHAFYIIGLPWETKKTLNDTLKFAKKLDTDFFDFNIAYPLPGTELYEMAKKEKLLIRDENPFEKGGYAQASLRTYTLDPHFLTLYRRKILLTLYCRPGYIYRTLKNAGSPKVAINYIKSAIKRFFQIV